MDSVITDTWLIQTFFLVLAKSLLISMCVIWSELTPLVQTFIYYRPAFQSQHYKHAGYNRMLYGMFYVTATAISLMAAS